MTLGNYDSWKLVTPPEYDEPCTPCPHDSPSHCRSCDEDSEIEQHFADLEEMEKSHEDR